MTKKYNAFASGLFIAVVTFAPQALATPPVAYFDGLTESPTNNRGRTTPIGGNGGGFRYVDRDGWYSIILDRADAFRIPDGIPDFAFRTGSNIAVISVENAPSQEFIGVEGEMLRITPRLRSQNPDIVPQGVDTPITARKVITLGSRQTNSQRVPVPMAIWETMHPNAPAPPLFAVAGSVYTRRGQINLICVSDLSHAHCTNLLQARFRIEKFAFN